MDVSRTRSVASEVCKRNPKTVFRLTDDVRAVRAGGGSQEDPLGPSKNRATHHHHSFLKLHISKTWRASFLGPLDNRPQGCSSASTSGDLRTRLPSYGNKGENAIWILKSTEEHKLLLLS